MKKFKIFAIIILALIAISCFGTTQTGRNFWKSTELILKTQNREDIANDYEFNVHFLEVGKADTILIENNETVILIDTGTFTSFDYINSYLKRRNIKTINELFITHPDADHVGSAGLILENYLVENVYMSSVKSESQEYCLFIENIEKFNVNVQTINENCSFRFNEINIDVFSPKLEGASVNNSSLVLKVNFKDLTGLFMGDAEQEAEKYYIESNYDLKSDYIKIGHHGSKTSSTKEFLEYVSPNLAFISTGFDYGILPDYEVVKNLNSLNIEYFTTDQDGTIILSTNDGVNLNISTKEENYEKINN